MKRNALQLAMIGNICPNCGNVLVDDKEGKIVNVRREHLRVACVKCGETVGWYVAEDEHQEYVRLKPCPVCGKKPVLWRRDGLVAYACAECDTAAFFEKSERNARLKWNLYAERKEE